MRPLAPPRTHERPVSHSEESGLRVEGNVGARTLGVVVGATKLGASGREAAASDQGIGEPGPGNGGSEHLGQLERLQQVIWAVDNSP
jgi:hypothetical protein